MIKVLYCYKTYYPDTFGGIEQVIYQISEGGIKENIASTVYTHSPVKADEFELDHHKCVRSKTFFKIASPPFSLASFRRFKELAKNTDIIHYHFPYSFMDILHFLCQRKSLPS